MSFLTLWKSTNRRTLVILAAVLGLFGATTLFVGSNSKTVTVVVEEKEQLERCEDPTYIQDLKPQFVACNCADPSQPEDWFDNVGWDEQHERMVASASTSKGLDLVILGDSITERINGTRSLGKRFLPENRKVFESHFNREGGGKLDAIALGSSGDTTNNLLWHLQNGVLVDSLQPKVWMILIGTNNMGRTGCNQYTTGDGILSVVQYLREKRPDAKIILHGLLPRSERAMEANDDYTTGACRMRISWINEQLKSACHQEPYNCHYFEAPEVFLNSDLKINATTMTDGLHPSAEGMERWEPKIVDAVLNLMG